MNELETEMTESQLQLLAIICAAFYASVTAGVGYMFLDDVVQTVAYAMAVVGGVVAYLLLQHIYTSSFSGQSQ